MSKDQVNAPAYPLLCPATKDQSREKQSTENCGLNGPSFLLYATCVARIHNASAHINDEHEPPEPAATDA